MVDNNPVAPELLANQVQMIEDYQNASMQVQQQTQQQEQQPQQQAQQPQQQAQQPQQRWPQPPLPPQQQAKYADYYGGANNPAIEESNPVSQTAYDSIIAQQQAQIDALINANNNLTQQVTQMVQNGAQFYQPQQQPQQQVITSPGGMMQLNMKPLQDNEDYSLEALAKEIGKRDDLPPKK